jgi:hypothetical protein
MANFYVDTPHHYGTEVANKNPETAHYIQRYSAGGRWWCHLLTDGSEQDLYDFARRLFNSPRKAGEWLQNKGKPLCHYDLTPGMRLKAIKMGATAIPEEHDANRALFHTILARRTALLAGEGGGDNAVEESVPPPDDSTLTPRRLPLWSGDLPPNEP